MDCGEFFGIRLAACDADEAVGIDWGRAAPDVDVVRVSAPPLEAWDALRAAGFVCKPNRVSWLAPTGASDDEFQLRLSGKDRQNLRTALRRAEAAGLRIELDVPVTAELLGEFLPMYSEQIARMRYGFPAAVRQREQLVDDPAYFAVVASDPAGRLVGACICHAGDDLVRVRFSAVPDTGRDASLARVLYFRAVQAARERGCTRVTLGHDPNLYGHIPKPGLFSFKLRLGFSPVPPQECVAGDRVDEADLVRRLDAFTDPALVLGYRGDGADGVELHVLSDSSASGTPDLRPLTHALAPPLTMHAVPRGTP